jgi:O-antigen ligase
MIRSKADLLYLAGVMAVVAYVSIVHLDALWILIAVPILLAGFVLTAHRFSETLLLATTTCMVFVVYNYPGLDPGEVVYYLLWAASVGLVLIPLLLTGVIRAETTLDRLHVLFMVFMIWGIVNGILFSGSASKPILEALYFYSGVVFYFLYRQYLDRSAFRIGLAISVGFIFIYVVLRTYLSYRTALLMAVEEWEFNFVRGAGNESILLFGTSFCLAALLTAKSFRMKLALLVGLIVSIGAVIVTMTRSLWVVTMLAMLVVFLVSEKTERRRFLTYLGIATSLTGILAVYYWEFTLFIIEILKFRFNSLGDGLQDLSLLERYYEMQHVWERIKENPISGWGFGTEYSRYEILKNRATAMRSYIHNGYLALWYKISIFGLLTMLAYFVILFNVARNRFIHSSSAAIRLIAISTVAYIPAAGLMNITSPVFFTFEGTWLLFTLGSVLSWSQVRESEPNNSSAT